MLVGRRSLVHAEEAADLPQRRREKTRGLSDGAENAAPEDAPRQAARDPAR
ncbi:hypothetical protein [Nonomuraea rhodomycinica]|uniref:Uncharacterized protein n=1 Tax=Nonomuraea rhodomycinica TaxID=1712872 RepID=A0A7Y6M9K4_9ACTN|nr:hypothetical protein [Nonomuraea rhodomycinica]NUW38870.1 hypothetical protein [Nonomuraea rhodomycinica]